MAGATRFVHRGAVPMDSAFLEEFNKAVADLELLRARVQAICAKLDADAGVTDTNYAGGTYGTTAPINVATVLTAGLIQG